MTRVEGTASENADRGAKGIEKPGTYHLMITGFDPTPVDTNGTLQTAWKVTVGILAGTDKTQVGKSHDMYFNEPNLSYADKGKFAKKIRTRFLFVVGLLSEGDFGVDFGFDSDDSIGRQFVATFSENAHSNRTSMQLNGCDLWHVDDSYIDSIPRDLEMLKSIPANLRLDAKNKAKAAAAKDSEYSEPTDKQGPSDPVSYGDI